MSLFSSKSFSQPPLTPLASAMLPRVSPDLTSYEPLPVFGATGASARSERVTGASGRLVSFFGVALVSVFFVSVFLVSVFFGLVGVVVSPPPVDEEFDRPLPQCGQAPLPWTLRTFSATAICWAFEAWLACGAYDLPPNPAHVEDENCRPP